MTLPAKSNFDALLNKELEAVDLNGMSINEDIREAWLDARAKRIGASDASTAIGINEYSSKLNLWLEKSGKKPRENKKMNEKMEWGVRHERTIIEAYAEKTGQGIIANQIFLIGKKYDWQCATLDAITESGRILEVKTADKDQAFKWGESGTDEVPHNYLVQVTHQAIIAREHFTLAEIDKVDIAVLIGGNDFRIYTVTVNQKLIDLVIKKELEFMEHVWSGIAPEPELPRDNAIIKYMYQDEIGSVNFDEDMTASVDSWFKVKEEIKKLEEQEDATKVKILMAIGDARQAILDGGRILDRKIINRKACTSNVKATSYPTLKIRKAQ